MQCLTTDLIRQACSIFLPLAYPGGDGAVPAKKQGLLNLPRGLDLLDHLSADAATRDCCQLVFGKTGSVRAVLFRLGCTHYPHLKLKVQLVDHDQGAVWLVGVDTHDAYSPTSFLPPPGHPDVAAWATLQAANAALKERIEAAWDQAGLTTFNGLLRRDLNKPPPSPK
jgi:hypothetical protein